MSAPLGIQEKRSLPSSGRFSRPTRRSFLAAGGAVVALLGLKALPACSKAGPRQGNSRVVVVGAGMAGIAAASRLASSGFDVIVLEARNRIGGRIFTDRSLGVPVDFGAQWIEGTSGNPIARIAESIGATTRSTDEEKTALYDPDGGRISGTRLDTVSEMPERLESEIEGVENSINGATSLLDAIRMTPTGSRTGPDLDWVAETWKIGVAEDLDRVSALYVEEGDEFDGDSVILPGGYDKLVEMSAAGLDIRAGEPALEVGYTESQAVVRTSKAEYVADRVVVTVPLGVLKSGSPKFSASIGAAKEKAIAGLGFGTVTKVALLFSERFWPGDVDFLGFEASPSAPFEVMLRIDAEKPLLLAYGAGDAARRISSLTDRDVADLAIARLGAAFRVPPLERAVVWRWDVDPWARGAYSNIPVGQTPKLRELLAAPVANRIFFAGEATSTEYPGTVHGAYLSGIREADRIAGL